MQKKILIVTEYFYPEEFKINDVALEWQNQGYEVDVLTMVPSYPVGEVYEGYKNSWHQVDEWNGVKIHRVKAVTGYKQSLFKKLLKYFSFMTTGSIASLFIGKRYDYVFGYNMSALTGMMPAVVIKKLYKKPITFWAQDLWPDSVYAYGFKKTKMLSFFLDKFVGFMYRSVDGIAISGKGFESKLKPYCKEGQKFHYLPNWADDLDMSMEPYKFSDDNKIHFTFAGNVGKVQNLENIIKAFAGLDKSISNKAQLNIIGDGSALEDLKNIAPENTSIVFHGRKPRETMAMYFKGSDFLIVSLIDEPIFSLTVPAKTQTYIAAKKPILAIVNGDAAEIIKENNLGYSAHPSNIDEIRSIFIKAIDCDDKQKHEFTKNCEVLTDNVFNQEKTINMLLSLTLTPDK